MAIPKYEVYNENDLNLVNMQTILLRSFQNRTLQIIYQNG